MHSIKTNIPALAASALLISALTGSYVLIAYAQDSSSVEYPIEELGGCTSGADCREYCNTPGNIDNCVRYGLAHGLMSKEEGERARKFLSIGRGPGGCTNGEECRNYCNDPTHTDECLAFAEEHDILDGDELSEARHVSRLLKDGGELPGGCTNRAECANYCNNPAHITECLDFAEKEGFLKDKELDEARNIAKALASGISLPGGCTDKTSCRDYCSDDAHTDECIAFAEAAGIIDKDNSNRARKFKKLIASGETPGECDSREACRDYCSDESNREECISFSERMGFVDSDRADMIRQTGGAGPGGCSTKAECEEFCNNLDNHEACFAFAHEHHLIDEDKLQDLEEGVSRLRGSLTGAPPEVSECLVNTLGANILEKIRAGELTPGQEIGESVKQCFVEFSPNEKEEMHDRNDAGEIRDRIHDQEDASSSEDLEVEMKRRMEIEREGHLTPSSTDRLRPPSDRRPDPIREDEFKSDDFHDSDSHEQESHESDGASSKTGSRRFFGFLLGSLGSMIGR